MLQQLIGKITKWGDRGKKAKPRNVVYPVAYPRFTLNGSTDVVSVNSPFNAMLRFLMTDSDVLEPRAFLRTLNLYRKVHPDTRAQLKLHHPFFILATGDGKTAHGASRTRHGGYAQMTEKTKLLHDGFCFDSDLEGQPGGITIEREQPDLAVVVHDIRPMFFEDHGLAWWWLTPVDKILMQGEVSFERDVNGFGSAYIARLPEALNVRMVAAIFQQRGYGIK